MPLGRAPEPFSDSDWPFEVKWEQPRRFYGQTRSGYVIVFATADSRDSSRPDHAFGVENGFHVDVEGFHSAARFRQPGHRLDDEV
jgi:hypothetical protein